MKILIIGCSHSNYSYKLRDPKDPSKGDRPNFEDGKTWAHFVKMFEQHEVTILSCGGWGYWGFSQILSLIDINSSPAYLIQELNFYDMLIVQETNPRFELISDKAITKFETKNQGIGFDSDRIIVHDNYVLKDKSNALIYNGHHDRGRSWARLHNIIYDDSVKNWHKLLLSECVVIGKFDYLCGIHIENLCKKYKIPMFVFSMYDPLLECSYSTRLDNVNNLYDKIEKLNLLSCNDKKFTSKYGYHASYDGMKFIGNIINESLKNVVN